MINWKNELEKYNDEFEAININGKMYLGNKVKAALRVLAKEFNSVIEGQPFFAWSRDWVYFCVGHNGSEWIERVPRDPTKKIPTHVGGY